MAITSPIADLGFVNAFLCTFTLELFLCTCNYQQKLTQLNIIFLTSAGKDKKTVYKLLITNSLDRVHKTYLPSRVNPSCQSILNDISIHTWLILDQHSVDSRLSVGQLICIDQKVVDIWPTHQDVERVSIESSVNLGVDGVSIACWLTASIKDNNWQSAGNF